MLAYDGANWILTPAAAAGSILYFNGANWINLAPGADGSVLTLAGGLPTWAP